MNVVVRLAQLDGKVNMLRLTAALLFLFAAPVAMARGDTLLVANKGVSSVSLLSLPGGHSIATVATGEQPHEIAVSPDGSTAAVSDYDGTAIDLIDIATHKKLRTLDIAPNSRPHGIAWLDNDRIIVTAEGSRSVVIVSRDGTLRSIPTDQNGTHMIVVSPDARTAYTANVNSGTISVLNLKEGTKVRDIRVGGKPEGLALTRGGRELWVGDLSDPRVQVIDLSTDKQVAVLPVSPLAIRIAASPDGRYVATSSIDTGTVGLFDAERHVPIRTISVSDDGAAKQVAIVFSRDSKRLYAVETARATIAEIEIASGAVLRRFTAAHAGDGLAIAPPSRAVGRK